MLRLPRLLSFRSIQSLTLASSLALGVSIVSLTFAQDAPPVTPPAAGGAATPAAPGAAAPAAPAAVVPPPVTLPPNETLDSSIENFWHYIKIARYDVATTEAQRIIAQNPDPSDLLLRFEKTAADHHDQLDTWLLRIQGVDAMKDSATQLITILSKGHEARRADPIYIEQNIKLLSQNERGYELAIDRLRDSGELAVPIMVADLLDPAKKEYGASIRRGLRDMGLPAVSPLLAATEMRDHDTLMTVVDVLGDLGYDAAVPYLSRLMADPGTAGDVKDSVIDAMRRLRVADPGLLIPANEFYALSEKFYYDNSAVRADKKNKIGRIWYWGEQTGLTFKEVPQPIFHDVMCKRAAEYALKLGRANGDISDNALSLWVSAAYQDEAELPAGGKDTTLAADAPTAHYWGSSVGTKYLNIALTRANQDRNAPVAMRIIQSLQDVGGQANLFAGPEHPLMDALVFPDRLVRYEAAFALAGALPRQSFVSEERVVPLLAEALSQTGATNVLVVVPAQDQMNGLIDGLKGQGYNVVGATNPNDAVAAAAARPAIDAIVMTDDLDQAAVQQMETLALQTPRLDRAVKLILTKTKSSPYQLQALTDTSVSTSQVKPTDLPALKVAIEDARKRAGVLPLDEATAARYATHAADLLAKVAINHSPVYDITMAQPLLMSALDDSRPEIVKYTATVLGLIDSPDIQPALLLKASADATADDLKVALYQALAANARNFGRHLDDDQIGILQKVVGTAANLDVKTAAGEARGAMDLPADQAKKLIIDQAKTTN